MTLHEFTKSPDFLVWLPTPKIETVSSRMTFDSTWVVWNRRLSHVGISWYFLYESLIPRFHQTCKQFSCRGTSAPWFLRILSLEEPMQASHSSKGGGTFLWILGIEWSCHNYDLLTWVSSVLWLLLHKKCQQTHWLNLALSSINDFSYENQEHVSTTQMQRFQSQVAMIAFIVYGVAYVGKLHYERSLRSNK